MKKRLLAILALWAALALLLAGCGSAREVNAVFPGGGGGTTQGTQQETSASGGGGVTQPPPPPPPSSIPMAPVEYKTYSLYEVTDPVFSNMVAHRTLIPEGWTPQSGVEWSYNSADAPAQIWLEASSANGAAYLFTMSEACYAINYTMGASGPAWGYAMREPFTAEAAALEYLESTGISDVSFASREPAPTAAEEAAAYAQNMEQLAQLLAQYRQELQNPYFEHMVFEGTGYRDGGAFDVRVDVAVYSHRSYSNYVSIDYTTMAGITLMLTPQGMMGSYLADMLDIQANGSRNENWSIGRQQVTEQIYAELRDRQQQEWAAARALSAQLSARVDAIIAHTNAWIASTDAMMFNHSSMWSDYILDQTNYYTPDGGTVAVPSEWDYAWMGNDGSVYVSNESDLFDNPNLNPDAGTYYTQMDPVG